MNEVVRHLRRVLIAWGLVGGLLGCVGVPEGLQVVQGFDVSRFGGQWYEIVRGDHSFERGLSQVSAHYTVNADGTLTVVNRGYQAASGRWREARGVARFVGDRQQAALKVSFFWPFYGSYNVIALDPDYQWALICGADRSYFWLLARTPQLDPALQEQLLQRAEALGFDRAALLPGQ